MPETGTDKYRAASAIVQAAPAAPVVRVNRRSAIVATFWAGITALVAGGIGTVVNTVYPRGVTGFGGPITVAANRVPAAGDPPRPFIEGRFLLVNLAPGEGALPGEIAMAQGGLIALYRKCPHLGCTVPWRGDMNYRGLQGVFRCPCHASTYTRAGVRVWGPAPRSMDTMAIELLDTGDIVVQTGSITEGGVDNPSRAMPYRKPSEA